MHDAHLFSIMHEWTAQSGDYPIAGAWKPCSGNLIWGGALYPGTMAVPLLCFK